MFELLVISAPGSDPNEFEQINAMFEEGLTALHLRKPGFSRDAYLSALKQIRPAFLRRVILHDHHELAGKYNIGGFHMTRKALEQTPAVLEELFSFCKTKGLKLSCSLHSPKELKLVVNKFDYYFLSPIFPSISKPGYKAKLDLKQIKPILKEVSHKAKFIGLGGVDTGNLELLREAGFNGAAVLGSLWNATDPLEKFRELKGKIASR